MCVPNAMLPVLVRRAFDLAQVYIYGCVEATINITGKCKMVAIDGCKKTKVSTTFDAV